MGHFLLVWWGIFKVSGIFLSFEIRKCIFWLCSREGFISSKYQIFRHSKLFKVISCSRLRANEPQTEVVYQGKNNKVKIQISGLLKNQNNNLKYTTMVYWNSCWSYLHQPSVGTWYVWKEWISFFLEFIFNKFVLMKS